MERGNESRMRAGFADFDHRNPVSTGKQVNVDIHQELLS
jgi:hypothetical protein